MMLSDVPSGHIAPISTVRQRDKFCGVEAVIRLIDISPKQRQHHDPKKSPDHAAEGDQGQETNE
jgi:hypothetical protein